MIKNLLNLVIQEIIMDDPQPIYINGDCVERVSVFRILSLHLEEDLSWKANATALVKKAQQRLHFQRILKKNNMEEKLLLSFYRCSIESVLTYCISVWFTSCTAGERSALQRVVNTAQKIIGCVLLPLEELCRSCCLRKTSSIYTYMYILSLTALVVFSKIVFKWLHFLSFTSTVQESAF